MRLGETRGSGRACVRREARRPAGPRSKRDDDVVDNRNAGGSVAEATGVAVLMTLVLTPVPMARPRRLGFAGDRRALRRDRKSRRHGARDADPARDGLQDHGERQ